MPRLRGGARPSTAVVAFCGAVLSTSTFSLQSWAREQRATAEDPVSVLNSLDQEIFAAPTTGGNNDVSSAPRATAERQNDPSNRAIQKVAFLEESKSGFRLQCPPGQPCNCNCHCNKAAAGPPGGGGAAAAAALAPPPPPPPPPVVVSSAFNVVR